MAEPENVRVTGDVLLLMFGSATLGWALAWLVAVLLMAYGGRDRHGG